MTDLWRQQQELDEQQQEELEELEREQGLDLDAIYSADGEWWREQDSDMTSEELADIEARAEIQEYRTQGYM